MLANRHSVKIAGHGGAPYQSIGSDVVRHGYLGIRREVGHDLLHDELPFLEASSEAFIVEVKRIAGKGYSLCAVVGHELTAPLFQQLRQVAPKGGQGCLGQGRNLWKIRRLSAGIIRRRDDFWRRRPSFGNGSRAEEIIIVR